MNSRAPAKPNGSPGISFCMIVRNAAATLRACLDSVADICDEIVIIDTGSTDNSEAVALDVGARVIRAAWADDFATARNLYVAEARYGWILSLDADETLGPVDPLRFRQLLAQTRKSAFLFSIRNYLPLGVEPELVLPSRVKADPGSAFQFVITKTIRLFRREPNIRYCYPVHESLIPALRRSRLRIGSCSIPIHHFGSVARSEMRTTKADLYRRLGYEKIQRFPKHFAGYLELGRVLYHDGRFEDAATMFSEVVRLRPKCWDAHLYLAATLLRLGQFGNSLTVIARVLKGAPLNQDARMLLRLLMDRQPHTNISAVRS